MGSGSSKQISTYNVYKSNKVEPIKPLTKIDKYIEVISRFKRQMLYNDLKNNKIDINKTYFSGHLCYY